jgi:acyl carrier protein
MISIRGADVTRSGAANEGTGLGRLARSIFRGRAEKRAEAVEPVEQEVKPVVPPAARRSSGVDVDAILEDLRRFTAEISDEKLRAEELDPDAGIFDEGYVDSMSYVNLLARVEERYRVAVPDEVVAGSSLRDIARYVSEEAAA